MHIYSKTGLEDAGETELQLSISTSIVVDGMTAWTILLSR